MKPIVKVPNKVLIQPAREVKKVNAEVQKIIADMQDALVKADKPKGVGLAATQIGISLRIFLLWADENEPIQTVINPVYVSKSTETLEGIPEANRRKGKGMEGCLSIPHIWGFVTRHQSVTISYIDEEEKKRTQTFTDFPAIVVQHEIDHLDGILFTRRVVEQKGALYQPVQDEHGKETLEPIEF